MILQDCVKQRAFLKCLDILNDEVLIRISKNRKRAVDIKDIQKG
jgi:hypothetical protein